MWANPEGIPSATLAGPALAEKGRATVSMICQVTPGGGESGTLWSREDGAGVAGGEGMLGDDAACFVTA
ncbi:MAG: hypothetical protein ACLPR9_12390 [Acidimicrobiales bacterium]